MKLIDKDYLIQYLTGMADAECCDDNTERIIKKYIIPHINTLEVKDPYEKCIQYDSIKAGIKAHAEIYSFNIESELFNQLTKEQQVLWRKEIEQACISGSNVGVELARDIRYKENVEMKEVDLEKEMDKEWNKCEPIDEGMGLEIASIEHEQFDNIAKHFFELGMSVNNKAQKGE